MEGEACDDDDDDGDGDGDGDNDDDIDDVDHDDDDDDVDLPVQLLGASRQGQVCCWAAHAWILITPG